MPQVAENLLEYALIDDLLYLARKSQALQARAKLIQSIRLFFIHHDFLEVETPLRIPSPAPEEHIEAIPSGDWFLQTSPELCMKRLLAAGYPRIFQISKCFRAAERGNKHLPEFTMLEWYVAGFDYHQLMDQCEEMLIAALKDMGHRSRSSSGKIKKNKFSFALGKNHRRGRLFKIRAGYFGRSAGSG